MNLRITPLAVNSAISLFSGISREISKATVLIFFLFFSVGLTMGQVTTTESFETAVPPTGWSSAIGSGTYNWTRATTTGLPNGSYYAYYDSYDADAGNYASLVSSAFDLSSRGSNTPTVSLYFYRGSSYIDYPDYLEVYINTTNSLSGATLLSTGGSSRLYRHYTLAPVAATSGWFQYTFNLPADFNGNSNYIILKAVSGWGYNLCIDQVQIVSYPCVNPTITSTTPASGVGPNTYTLGATASQGTINWYAAASGGSVIATGTSYTTPNISATTTYYVNATYNVCSSSPRVPVVATIASHYDAGAGIAIAGTTITNTAPDQTVTLTGNGATSVSGTYPNFTINSSDNNTTYNAGTGIDISNGSITNSAPDQTVTLTGNGATSVTGTYPNFTISSTDNNTTYTPGTGLSLTGNTLNSVWTRFGLNISNNTEGFVGIGTSAPSERLDVRGNVLVHGHITSDTLLVSNSICNIVQATDHIKIGNHSLILSSHPGTSTTENSIYTENSDNILIQSNDANHTGHTILNGWNNTGNVGIGTSVDTDPTAKLDLVGSFRLRPIDNMNLPEQGKILSSDNNGFATWQDPIIKTVGAGLTLLNGEITNSLNFIAGAGISINNNVISSNVSYLAGTGLYMTDNTINSVWTYDFDKLYNNTASFVGIGTDNPLVNLHLKGITDCQLALPPHHSAIFRIEDNVIHEPDGLNRNVWWDMIVSGREHKFIFTSNDGIITQEVLNIKETGQVGIGVENPTESLEVSGAMVLGNTTNANPANGTIKFVDNQLKVFANGWQSFSGLWTAGTSSAGAATIYSASTANVGIGTGNPLVNFHVKGITDNNAGSDSPLSAIIRLEDHLINISPERDVSWDIVASAKHNKLVFRNQNSTMASNIFNNVFSIKENGSMGIGVDDPIEKLEVDGNVKANGIKFLDGIQTEAAKFYSAGDGININPATNEISLLPISITGVGATITGNNLSGFTITVPTVTVPNYLAGLGLSPLTGNNTFNVDFGGSGSSNTVAHSDHTHTGYGAIGSSGNIQFKGASGEFASNNNLFWDVSTSSLGIGIGNTTPAANVQINGTYPSSKPILWLHDWLEYDAASSYNLFVIDRKNEYQYNNHSTAFVVTHNGNVGIGKIGSSLIEKLEVDGAIKIGTTILGTATQGTIIFNGSEFKGYNGTQWIAFKGGPWNTASSGIGSSVYNYCTDKIMIGSANTPSSLLQIESSNPDVFLKHTGTYPVDLKLGAEDNTGRLSSTKSIACTIDNGTPSGSSAFYIYSNTNLLFNLGRDYLELHSLNLNFLNSSNAYTMRLEGEQGYIYCRKLTVQPNGPIGDFVFDNDYKLRTLYEDEQYYKENKHLYNIPSQKEVNDNGMDIDKFVSLLLQKVEEGTIHNVEQQKQIDKLSKQLEELKTIIKQGNK